MSKTLKLIEQYETLLEQDLEDPSMGDEMEMDAQDITEPDPPQQEEMPLTSQAEDDYIAMVVDAALYEPSPEEAKTLLNLQSALKLKRYQNSREEVLPTVLSIINASSSGGDIRKDLSEFD